MERQTPGSFMNETSKYIRVKVTTKASEDKVIGWKNEELRVKVTEPPEKGKANRAVIRLLAKHFDVAQRDVILVQGETSRHKRFCIDCVEKVGGRYD